MRLPIVAGLATAAVMTTLYPLFKGGGWFWACLGAILVITVIGAPISRFTSSIWITRGAMLLGLWVYLTTAFAADDAWLRVIPTKDSVIRLIELFAAGYDDVQHYAAPVPATPGIRLITACGVGLVAIMVDLLAVRLRRAALAGLPLLALFTVPAAVLTDPIGWPAFVLGALGYVGLLVADGRERLAHWGRAIVVRRSRGIAQGVTPDTGRLALSGKRIGMAAIALAILVPGLLPPLVPDPLFGFGVGNGNGSGPGSTIAIPDAIVELGGQLRQAENATVLTYTTSDGEPRYFRIYALDVFDGRKWTFSSLRGRQEDRVSEGPLPPAPGLGPGVAVKRARTQVKISEDIKELNFLPLPYPATRVEVDGDWRADRSSLMVFSTRDQAAGLEYLVETGEPRPTPQQLEVTWAPLDTAELQRYLELPANLNPRISALAHEIAGSAGSPYRQAVRLQEWFTKDGGFTYSLQASGNGEAALSRFLFRTRTGYCEQFASAMAVMARALGIPARVASGYTGGTKTGEFWTVGTHDSHAWPELYFEGIGWLRFEPTPGGVAGQGTARTPDYSLPQAATADDPTVAPSAAASPGADETGAADDPARPNPRQLDPERDAAPAVADPGLPVATKIGAGAALALMLALTPAMLRRLIGYRRRRALLRGGRAAAGAAWAELGDLLTDLGMSRRPSESPRALGRRLAEQYALDEEAAAALGRITAAEERLRYARTPAADAPRPADIAAVRRGLTSTMSRWRRLGAAIAPMSVLLRIRALGTRLLDVVDLLGNIRPGRNRDLAGARR